MGFQWAICDDAGRKLRVWFDAKAGQWQWAFSRTHYTLWRTPQQAAAWANEVRHFSRHLDLMKVEKGASA